MRKGLKIARTSLLTIIVTVVVGVQFVLNSSIATSFINKTTAKFLDGTELNFARHNVSIWRHFPKIKVSIDSISINELAPLDHIEATADPWKFLFRDSLVIDSLNARGLRLNAINYGRDSVNWDIFASSSKKDTSTAAIPAIVLKQLLIEDAALSFNSLPDTLQAQLQLDTLRSAAELRIAGDSINISKLDLILRSKLAASISDDIAADLKLDLDAEASGVYSPDSFPESAH